MVNATKSLKNILKILAPYLFLIFLCICLTPHPLQNDTFYLVKIGNHIINSGIDLKDHYTWVADLTYTYPHFLFNILCYAFYALLDWNGLYILSIILFSFFACSLFFILKYETKKFISSHPLLAPSTKKFVSILPFLLGMLSVILLPIFVSARSQIITYTVFVWEIFCLIRLFETKQVRFMFLLAFLSWLVAICHATIWPFFFILFLPFIAEFLITKFFKKKSKKASLTSLVNKFEPVPKFAKGTGKLLSFALILSMLVGLLTPGRICYTAIFKIMQGSTQDSIIEHAPLVLKENPEAIVIILLFFIVFAFTKARLRPRDFFLFAGLFALSFLSTRHLSFLLTIAFIPLLHLLLSWSEFVNPKFFEGIIKLTPKPLILFVIAILASLQFIEELRKPLLDPSIAPTEAVAFLKEHYPSIKDIDLNSNRAISTENVVHLFNGYDFGAYLLSQDIPVFIDSRVNIYTKPFSANLESDIFEDYKTIKTGEPEAFDLIEKYGITTLLLTKDDTLGKILARDSGYKEIYSDELYVIYEKL